MVYRPRQRRRKHLFMKKQNYRNPYQYSDVCFTTPSATFNHRFRNVHQIHQSQSPTLEIGEATALWKKFQKMKHNLSKISALFLSPFHSPSDDFDMDSHDFDFDTLGTKQTQKKAYTKIWSISTIKAQIFLLLILYRTAKEFHFLLATPVSIILFFEIINRPFRTKTL